MVFQLLNINTTKGISMTNFVTPKGIAVWPKLNAPDYKFNVDGEYKTTLKIEASKSQDLTGMKKLRTILRLLSMI